MGANAIRKGPRVEERQEPLIPGVEPERVADIEAAADKLIAAKEAAKSQAEEVKFATECLIGEMKERNLTEYRCGSYIVTVSPKDSVKIKKQPQRKAEAE